MRYHNNVGRIYHDLRIAQSKNPDPDELRRLFDEYGTAEVPGTSNPVLWLINAMIQLLRSLLP